MTNLVGRTLYRLGERLPGRLSTPGDPGYADATAIWAKPVGHAPRAVVHCRTAQDVALAIRAACDCDLPLSVRGGGHDWAGRALCNGIVIDLSGMRSVAVGSDGAARISWRRPRYGRSRNHPFAWPCRRDRLGRRRRQGRTDAWRRLWTADRPFRARGRHSCRSRGGPRRWTHRFCQ